MKYITTLLLAFIITGCSTITGYTPVVNEKADKNVATVNEDLEYCKGLALKTAGYAGETAMDTLALAGYSAATGALAGAIIPGTVSAGTGAAIGAPIGAVTGLFWGLYESDERFVNSFNTCMVQLNHPVLR